MNIRTLEWDPQIAADMGIPMSMLPEIKSSSEVYGFGRATGLLSGTPIAGILGDQQAATSVRLASRRAWRRTPTVPVTSCS